MAVPRRFRGVGTRDWAARESLRGERGCASEPVAREGRDGRGVGGGAEAGSGGGGDGPGGPKSREIGPRFFRNGRVGGEVSSTFPSFGLFEHFWPNLENFFGRPFWCLCILWREYAIHVFHECSLSFLETSYFPQISHTLEKLIKLSSDLGPLLKNLGTDLPFLGTSPSGPPPDRLRPLRPLDRHAPHARPARPHSPSHRKDSP